MVLATNSLPVPLSPCRRTVAALSATRPIISKSCCMAGLRPSTPPKDSRPTGGAGRAGAGSGGRGGGPGSSTSSTKAVSPRSDASGKACNRPQGKRASRRGTAPEGTAQDVIARGGRPPCFPRPEGPSGRLVGIDDRAVAIHDRDAVGHAARELADRLQPRAQHGIRAALGGGGLCERSGHLDLVT